ncbi:MAG TPA: sigma-54 dependent transcriptional regulator [Vicinamibacterales bacterium]|nr:sigma-54 dependent transcriptional regulator [Vicinamibacterales bacterium]
MAPARILLVEDKDSLRAMLKLALESQDYVVIEARDAEEAAAALREAQPSLVLSDLRLPKGDGLGVLRATKELDAELPVIVMTAHGSIQDAVEAMKQGALDFLAKPVDPDHLLLLVSRALEQRRLMGEYRLLKEEAAARRGGRGIIGDAPALKQVLSAIERAAGTDTTVLLEGESGTGKELCARALHDQSARVNGPFVAINCAAIPENLLEAELFGYERGAFTGATQRKIGKFEMAQRGTIFLDEIGEMPLGLQAKMLRAIETKRIERLGGGAPIQVDVRIVAATNRLLRQAVAARQFREDLYFRLSVFPVTVPPLRERKDDIPKLAHHFVDRVSRDVGKKLTLSPEVLTVLTEHAWPGNVRELQNAIERAVILADGDRLLPRHLSLAPAQAAAAQDPWDQLDWSGTLADVTTRFAEEAEKRKLAQALKQANGDKGRAADLLNISFKTLTARLKHHRLD